MDDILILPTQPEHAQALDTLQEIVYGARGYRKDELISAAMFQRHVAIFPDGQFVAVELSSGRVVGHTSSMLFMFDLEQPRLHSWYDVTDHGWLTPHR